DDRIYVVERATLVEAIQHRAGDAGRAAAVGERELRTLVLLRLLGFLVGQVECALENARRPELEGGEISVALQQVRNVVVLGAADDEIAARIGGVAPGRLMQDVSRIGLEIDPERDAERMLEELVGEDAVDFVAAIAVPGTWHHLARL